MSTKSLILLFCVCAGILFDLLIPPFQNPDEPEHFGLILTYSLGSERKSDIEREIIRLLDSHSWWRFIGMERPPVLPENFMKIDFLMLRDFRERIGSTAVYHYLLGKFGQVAFRGNVLAFYYLCRLISILLTITSIFLIFSSLKKMPGLTTGPIFPASFLSVLFLPQLMTISVSVNPDGLSFFLSALFFYASISLLADRLRILYLMGLILATGLSLFADRSVFFLVIMFILLPFFWIKKTNLKRDLGLTLIYFLVAIMVVSWIVWYVPAPFYGIVAGLRPFASDKLSAAAKLFAVTPFNKSFWLYLSDSFFLKFGWMAFSADRIFYYILRALVPLSLLGILIYLGLCRHSRRKERHCSLSDPLIPRLILFSVIAVISQVLGVWIPCASENILPQGRYLYPTMIPIVFLFWLGIESFFSVFHKTAGRIAVSVLLIGEFFFLNYAIWNYIIPVFHLTVKSPHPGI